MNSLKVCEFMHYCMLCTLPHWDRKQKDPKSLLTSHFQPAPASSIKYELFYSSTSRYLKAISSKVIEEDSQCLSLFPAWVCIGLFIHVYKTHKHIRTGYEKASANPALLQIFCCTGTVISGICPLPHVHSACSIAEQWHFRLLTDLYCHLPFCFPWLCAILD